MIFHLSCFNAFDQAIQNILRDSLVRKRAVRALAGDGDKPAGIFTVDRGLKKYPFAAKAGGLGRVFWCFIHGDNFLFLLCPISDNYPCYFSKYVLKHRLRLVEVMRGLMSQWQLKPKAAAFALGAFYPYGSIHKLNQKLGYNKSHACAFNIAGSQALKRDKQLFDFILA